MFLFGGKKNQVKKIENDFEDKVKSTVKGKLCPLCGKSPSTKTAFGQDVKPTLTCNNCELKAVGGVIQRLGPKNLITSQKFANLLTNDLINYQKCQAEPTIAHKQCSNLASNLDKTVQEMSSLIRTEFNTMKELSKTKVDELITQADKQHLMPLFDDTIRLYSEKKNVSPDFINEAMKRSLVNSKGVHFVDQQDLEKRRAQLNERFDELRRETKIKMNNLNSLINDINNISLQ